MSKKPIRDNGCRECGKPGKYYYSKELAEFLGLVLWEGVYFCDGHLQETLRDWESKNGMAK